MLRTAPLAPPITGLSNTVASTRPVSRPSRQSRHRASVQLPGPDFHRQATTRVLRRDTKIDYPELIATPPALLDALQIL